MRNSLPGRRLPLAYLRRAQLAALFAAFALLSCPMLRADEPYARDRNYDLRNARIALRFDLAERKVTGDVTHTLAALRDAVSKLEFDSVGLTIQSVTVGGKPAKFETPSGKLVVALDKPAKAGETLSVNIHYEGRPKKGLYFVLPDKDYPDRPAEVWTQGEAEDTRYYIPIYDYPNDMTSTQMILTVPAKWITVSNGRLVSVKDAPGGMKVWSWNQSQPHATYLISIVAGEFDESKEVWRGKPLLFYAPRGRGERIPPTFNHVKQILDFFSDSLGVLYPWDKYAISTVDDFVAGGMENTSATTNTAQSLVHPTLAWESLQNADGLNAHETAHQWFGDLVTCKDWGHLWLNEGFATYFQQLFTEHQYGADEFSYEMWQSRNGWLQQRQLFAVPIVTHSFEEAVQNAGNIYGKGGLVLNMLRSQLGDADFFKAMKHYLDTNRNKNVVTADLTKAIEEATGKNVDQFFDQWVYGAGAPRFEVSYAFDAALKQVKLDVKQTQKVEGAVGLFRVPIEIEITTAAGKKSHSINVSKASESFSFPADSAPLLVLFDKGNKILKSVEFKKDPKEWIYQLKNSETVADRADAAQELGKVKGSADAITALGEAALGDKSWGVRAQALRALGAIGGPDAQPRIRAGLANEQPWVRAVAVQLMGNFKDDPATAETLEKIFREDKAYRVRVAALHAIAQQKAKNAFALLKEAAGMDSIDEAFRAAALRAFGTLGDDRAVPLLQEWIVPGKQRNVRGAAVQALAALDRKNKDITKKLLAFLDEPSASPQFQFGVVSAIIGRGDMDAIPALEAWLKRTELPIGGSFVQSMIDRMKGQPAAGVPGAQPGAPAGGQPGPADTGQMMQMGMQIMQQLEALRKENAEFRDRLKKIEEKVGEKKP